MAKNVKIASAEVKMTPMMRQYHSIKKQHPDDILMFRMGDFYEMLFDDAVKASDALGIALTKRGRGTASEAPMCGVPFHAVEGYIATLIRNGIRVAICEQVSDPKDAQGGLVQREVVRVITPGTVLDESCMDGKDFQYLAALFEDGEALGMAFLEFSTGRFEVVELDGEERYISAADFLTSRDPAELVIPEDMQLDWLDDGFLKRRCLSKLDGWQFAGDYARNQLLDHFGTINLDGFGLEGLPLGLRASGAVISYIQQTQKGKALHIQSVKVLNRSAFMVLDAATQRNLELTRSLFDGNRRESLLGQIDMCQTALGSRLLKDWILHPLMSVNEIKDRQAFVTSFKNAVIARAELRQILKEIPDLDRQLSRLAMKSINPRELLGIGQSLARIPDMIQLIDEVVPDRYGLTDEQLAGLWEIYGQITQTLVDDPPTHTRNGGFIRDGVDMDLDELRQIRKDSRSVLAAIEARERDATGIPKLKIQYNKVFGYYIEVSKIHTAKVPESYIRKQTLVNCERYITDELKKYEEKILGAEEGILSLEQQRYEALIAACITQLPLLRVWSGTVARFDVHAAMAELAERRNYCLPQVNASEELRIVEGRHPVVEMLSTEAFIPNDTFLNCEDERLQIITGPNMGGKSTYLRQVALITLLAQIGSYVPAKEADVGVVDRIFTRVGASDHLARGQSTFMVEMTETANILHHATGRSLIILDEIGRGTSTFDGLSIAWAVAEYLVDKDAAGAKTLFATHYHEMTELEKLCNGVKNLHITVREWKNSIVFLRRIEKGAADQSYGVHVAKLAGLPSRVISRAKEILRNLEKNELDATGKPRLAKSKNSRLNAEPSGEMQMSLFGPETSPVLDEFRELVLDNLTPKQALDLLYRWRDLL